MIPHEIDAVQDHGLETMIIEHSDGMIVHQEHLMSAEISATIVQTPLVLNLFFG